MLEDLLGLSVVVQGVDVPRASVVEKIVAEDPVVFFTGGRLENAVSVHTVVFEVPAVVIAGCPLVLPLVGLFLTIFYLANVFRRVWVENVRFTALFTFSPFALVLGEDRTVFTEKYLHTVAMPQFSDRGLDSGLVRVLGVLVRFIHLRILVVEVGNLAVVN